MPLLEFAFNKKSRTFDNRVFNFLRSKLNGELDKEQFGTISKEDKTVTSSKEKEKFIKDILATCPPSLSEGGLHDFIKNALEQIGDIKPYLQNKQPLHKNPLLLKALLKKDVTLHRIYHDPFGVQIPGDYIKDRYVGYLKEQLLKTLYRNDQHELDYLI